MSMREEVTRTARESGVFESIPLPQLIPLERFYRAAYLAGAKAMQEEAAKVCEEDAAKAYEWTATSIPGLTFGGLIRDINPENLLAVE